MNRTLNFNDKKNKFINFFTKKKFLHILYFVLGSLSFLHILLFKFNLEHQALFICKCLITVILKTFILYIYQQFTEIMITNKIIKQIIYFILMFDFLYIIGSILLITPFKNFKMILMFFIKKNNHVFLNSLSINVFLFYLKSLIIFYVFCSIEKINNWKFFISIFIMSHLVFYLLEPVFANILAEHHNTNINNINEAKPTLLIF